MLNILCSNANDLSWNVEFTNEVSFNLATFKYNRSDYKSDHQKTFLSHKLQILMHHLKLRRLSKLAPDVVQIVHICECKLFKL